MDWECPSGTSLADAVTSLADAVKNTVLVNMPPIFLKNNLHLGTYAGSEALRNALLQWCSSSRNVGASSTTSAWNGARADDDNSMQVDSLQKGSGKGKDKHPKQKGTRTGNTDVNTCKNCDRAGHGKQVEEHTTNSDNNTYKGKNKKTGKGKGKQVDVVQTSQTAKAASTSQTPSTSEALWSNPETQQKKWIMHLGGVTIQLKQAGADHLLLDIGAQLHTCPIECEECYLPDPGILRSECSSSPT